MKFIENDFERVLKKSLSKILKEQGFIVQNKTIKSDLDFIDHADIRKMHKFSKNERFSKHLNSIVQNTNLVKEHTYLGNQIDVKKIKPKLILVTANTKWENIFRWWNFVWWSLPYEKAFGRQMRYIVWDDYHKSVIGLIGLHSPILSWAKRDTYLGIKANKRDFWVNQSMSAQRLGAVPPYNKILGGKLVSMLMTSNKIKNDFSKKYKNQRTLIKKRTLPSNLLFITTTGAFGKSSIYSRLRFDNIPVSKFIGYSEGAGSFHIPNYFFEELVLFLDSKGIDTTRGLGTGSSRKLRLISTALKMLDYKNGQFHNIKRGIYLFPLAKNLKELISETNTKPKWHKRNILELTNFWRERWAVKRVDENFMFKDFDMNEFFENEINKFKEYTEKVS